MDKLLDKKSQLNNNLNDILSFNYDFSINNNLDEVQYNSIGATIKKYNFISTFNSFRTITSCTTSRIM